MKRIILFRFHADIDVCRNRLRLLRKFNPDVKIHGLFGGREEDLDRFRRKLYPYLESLYCIRGKSRLWKRTHGDLAMRLWFEDVGKTVPFDVLHYIEWDLLLFEPLEKIYGHIPGNGVGLTSLTLLSDVAAEWYWLSSEALRNQWHGLLDVAKEKFSYDQEPLACEFAGACIPREFLEQYGKTEIPELGHDELRMPLFSQIFGFKCYNTHLCKKWFDVQEQQFFNCDKEAICFSTIQQELAKPSGRRAFHPVRGMVVFDIGSFWATRLAELKIFIQGLTHGWQRNS